jgi:hypothetical protein
MQSLDFGADHIEGHCISLYIIGLVPDFLQPWLPYTLEEPVHHLSYDNQISLSLSLSLSARRHIGTYTYQRSRLVENLPAAIYLFQPKRLHGLQMPTSPFPSLIHRRKFLLDELAQWWS